MKKSGAIKTAVVTGALGHIGSAICSALIKDNFFVYGVDLPSACEEALRSSHQFSQVERLTLLPLDLQDISHVEIIGDLLPSDLCVDLLVNNAAYYGADPGFDASFLDESSSAWLSVLKVNLIAPFFLVQKLYPFLLRSPSAAIVNIGTMYTRVGPSPSLYHGTLMKNPCSYSSSKAGLLGMTQWLSTMLAPHVRVNQISPGGLYRNQPELFTDRYLARTPLKSFCTEGDVAEMVLFLASPKARHITGQNIFIDGGFTSW